jgi:calcineurin-like phosphoesterase family protein
MSQIFLTSDSHFGHFNVIKYCNRPFTTVEEMNEALIANWNAVVGQEDIVFHLGDFSFHERYVEEFLSRLNGYKFLILGNHDKPHPANKGKTDKKFAEWVAKYKSLGFEDVLVKHTIVCQNHTFSLCHLPYNDPEDVQQANQTIVRYVNHRPEDDGTPQLCGHVHDRWLTKRSSKGTVMVNVGVDAPGASWYMRPARLEEVMEVYNAEIGK